MDVFGFFFRTDYCELKFKLYSLRSDTGTVITGLVLKAALYFVYPRGKVFPGFDKSSE